MSTVHDLPYGWEIDEERAAKYAEEARLDYLADRFEAEADQWPDCGSGECWHIQHDLDCPVELDELDEEARHG